MTSSSSIRPLNVLFVALVTLQGLFVLELTADVTLPALLVEHRSGWLLAEFLGTAVLFVDMVVRFDELHPKLPIPQYMWYGKTTPFVSENCASCRKFVASTGYIGLCFSDPSRAVPEWSRYLRRTDAATQVVHVCPCKSV